MTSDVVVAVAGEMLAVGRMETSAGEFFVTKVTAPSRVGSVAEAIGERS